MNVNEHEGEQTIGTWSLEFEVAVLQEAPDLLSSGVLDPMADLVVIGMDSLRLVSLIVALEVAFDVELPASAMNFTAVSTLQDLWGIISGLIDEKNIR